MEDFMIKNKGSKIFPILVLCIVCILIFASSCAGKNNPEKTVRISVPFSVSSIPVLNLNGKEVSGLMITTTVFQDHSITLAEFLKGDIDILMTGFTQGTSAYSGNKDVRHIATIVWGVSSLMVRDKSIKNISGLSGKTVIVPFAKSPLDLQLRAILKNKKMTSAVTIEYGPPQQAVALLLSGKTDAVAVPEPIASQLEDDGKAIRLFQFRNEWAEVTNGDTRSPQVSLFAMNKWAGKHTKAIDGLLKMIGETVKETNSDPVHFAELYANRFNLTRGVINTGLANTLFDEPGFDETVKLCNDYMAKIGLQPIDPQFYYRNK
jgi:hypothetical protein